MVSNKYLTDTREEPVAWCGEGVQSAEWRVRVAGWAVGRPATHLPTACSSVAPKPAPLPHQQQ